MKKREMSEIAQLKVDLRNKTAMYLNAKTRNECLKEKIRALESEKQELQIIITTQKADLERKNHTIDEYKRMIFRPSSKKKNNEENKDGIEKNGKKEENKENTKRSKESYTRKQPTADKITHTREALIERCPICKNPLVNIKEVERFVEDISLKDQKAKVTKYIIHSGFCKVCNKQRSLENIGTTVTSL